LIRFGLKSIQGRSLKQNNQQVKRPRCPEIGQLGLFILASPPDAELSLPSALNSATTHPSATSKYTSPARDNGDPPDTMLFRNSGAIVYGDAG